MTDKFIPIVDLRHSEGLSPIPMLAANGPAIDQLARPLHDLRISVTDRCNFRCVYCMPKEVFHADYPYLPHSALLSFEEIERIAKRFVALGVSKIRLTGGEPLLRKRIEHLIERLARLETPEGKPLDLTLTTNGSLLARKARDLKNAGLSRVTVSLDSLDDATFRAMNDVDFPVQSVLDGIAAADAVGLKPIKINMVVKRGVNDAEIVPMARHFKGTSCALRYIEYMDVGSTNRWKMDEVISADEILAHLGEHFVLTPVERAHASDTALRWQHADGGGEIGIIASVTKAFCGDCTRARLSTEGKLYTCLFAHQGYDLRVLLRNGSSDDMLTQALHGIWTQRSDRYSALRAQTEQTDTAGQPGPQRVEMSYIGG